ncbi:MAG: EamA family transporter [Chlorobi bacterium]|nr:EamA family transporter [Chlorobiota bacterium]
MKRTPSILILWASVILLSLIWGSTWLAIKYGLQDAPPMYSASFRFILASVMLFGYLKFKRKTLPQKLYFWKRSIFLAIFMFIIPYGLVYWGEVHISSGLASVLFSTQSLFVIPFAHFLLVNERASFRKWIGIFLGLSGLILIFNERLQWLTQWGLLGMFAIILAAVSGAFALVWLRKKEETIEPLTEVTAQIIITAIAFTIISLFFEPFPVILMSVKLGVSIVYLAIIGTAISYLIYYWLAKHTTALMISFSIFITPVFAVFMGWAFLNEMLGVKGFIGTTMVLSSIFIVQKSSKF